MKPLIGITSSTIHNTEHPYYPYVYGQMHTYAQAIHQAGGEPVYIPIHEGGDVAILDRLDGLLMSGGNDVSPELYGEKPVHIEERGSDRPRDDFELALVRRALELNRPILAICRGMQLLNVAYGGSLHQDIKSDLPGASEHDGKLIVEDFSYLAHDINIDTGTKLHNIFGTSVVQTNTHHHEAVKDVGQGLVVSAHAPDGIIEALEDPSHKFVIGVQSHPESLVTDDVNSPWHVVFQRFIEATH